MARKTFGRAGNIIEAVDGTAVEFTTVNIGGDDTGTTEIGIADTPGDDIIGEAGDSDGQSNDAGSGGEIASPSVGTSYVDPASIGQTPRRKRGPKPGVKYGPRKGGTGNTGSGSTVLLTANLEKVLFNLHVMTAGLLNEPDLVIDEDEAKILSDALTQVANAYDFSKVLSPKTQAGVDLAIALATVYGGRALKIAKKHGGRKPLAVVREMHANA